MWGFVGNKMYCATMLRACTFDAKSTKSLSPKKALAQCFALQNNPATVRYEPTLPNGKLRRLFGKLCCLLHKLGRLLRALRWFLAAYGEVSFVLRLGVIKLFFKIISARGTLLAT